MRGDGVDICLKDNKKPFLEEELLAAEPSSMVPGERIELS